MSRNRLQYQQLLTVVEICAIVFTSPKQKNLINKIRELVIQLGKTIDDPETGSGSNSTPAQYGNEWPRAKRLNDTVSTIRC